MQYSNELKVGAALVAAAVVFFLGIRYFEDIPLFRGTYELYTHFEDAGGLSSGSAVHVNGVNVGSVEDLALDTEADRVNVRFRLDSDLAIPQGSHAVISGLAALGSVSMSIELGPGSNPPVEPGGVIPGRAGGGGLGQLTEQAPELLGRVDSVLTGVDTAFDEAGTLLANPNSDLRQTLGAIRSSAEALTELLRAQEQRIAATLDSVAMLSGSLGTLAETSGDSLTQAVQNLNAVLDRLEANLASLESTTNTLDAILAKVNQGEGTLGLLVNDPSLYRRLDSTAAQLNNLLLDIQRDPRRYLSELDLVKIF